MRLYGLKALEGKELKIYNSMRNKKRGHVYYSHKSNEVFIYIGPLNGTNWVVLMGQCVPYTEKILGRRVFYVGEL